jgi:DNA-binding HxlR family transcriptional regulator
MKWQETSEIPCSVARTLSVIGDRWTLLVIRNAFLGMRRYEQFHANLGMTRHVLADRLSRLVDAEILAKEQYQQRPPRYEYRLTEKGRDLHPILMMLTAWGDKWMAQEQGAPLLFKHTVCGHIFTPTLACSECDAEVLVDDVAPIIGPGMRNQKQA